MAKLTRVKERLHKGYAQTMDVTRVLADEKSRYQHIRIFDTVANGRVMTLDDIVQITSRDESAYADMLTHLPMLEHGRVERVMIVGGGDLSIADEALKHASVKEVVLVDIDGRVIELCKTHFGSINAKAFKRQKADARSGRCVRISGPHAIQEPLRSDHRRPARSGRSGQGAVRRNLL